MPAITASLTNTNGTLQLPAIERDFIEVPQEFASDVETLDGSMYTDFVAQKNAWTFSYSSLTEDEYEAIKNYYDAQFSLADYPTLAIPHYSVSAPARMYLNERNVWNNCGAIEGLQLKFRVA